MTVFFASILLWLVFRIFQGQSRLFFRDMKAIGQILMMGFKIVVWVVTRGVQTLFRAKQPQSINN